MGKNDSDSLNSMKGVDVTMNVPDGKGGTTKINALLYHKNGAGMMRLTHQSRNKVIEAFGNSERDVSKRFIDAYCLEKYGVTREQLVQNQKRVAVPA